MNSLARTVAGITAYRVQYEQLVDKIGWRNEWRGQGLTPSKNLEDGYVIPYNICERITNLIEEHEKGQSRSEEAANLFFDTFLGRSDIDKIPELEKWKKARTFFFKHAHLREKTFSVDVSSKVKENFKILEVFLHISATSEYSRIGSLNEILEEANK